MHDDPGGTERTQSGVEMGGEHSALPRAGDLVAAASLLALLPLRRLHPQSAAAGRATLFFPLIGLFIGAVLAAANWAVAGRLPPWLAALLLVAVWEGLGRGEPLRACAASRPAHLPGPLLMLGIVFTKATCLAVTTGLRPAALLFAPTLARWAMVVLAVGAREAQHPGRKFNGAITFHQFAWTSVFSFAVVFVTAEALGIIVVVCTAAMTLGLRLLFHHRAGGVSWDMLLAGGACIETCVLALFALLGT
ncbi:MAG: hypothetical protein ACE5I7_09765 [Candidatus Binatia bacterium]